MRWCNILLERMKIERTVISKVIHVDYVKNAHTRRHFEHNRKTRNNQLEFF